MNVIMRMYPDALDFPKEIGQSVKAAAMKVGELYGLDNAEVSVTLTDNEHIHTINKKYRNIDRPTDVISFALNESDEPKIADEKVNVLGDVIISVERAKEQATEYGHSLKREVSFLMVHGMLHLLGYDHIEEADRIEMEKEQRYVMEKLGVPRE